jgi:hypothetical protein
MLAAAYFLLGFFMVFAAPPATRYVPGEVLDPTCLPGDVNCSVASSSGRVAATVTVAASDSVNAENANYVADGTADEVQIQAAIDAVAARGGGTVMLLEGTFNLADSVVFDDGDNNITLRGSGKNQTIIEGALAADVPYINLDSTGTTLSHIVISHMTIDGGDHAEDTVLQGGLINNTDTGNLENASFHDLRILIPSNRNNGIALWETTGGTNKYIRIYNNEIYQQFARTYGIVVRKYTEHIWIENNFISTESPALDAYNAIALYGGSRYFHVNNNSVIVSGTAHTSIAISTSSYGEVVGNVVEGAPNGGEGGIEVEWKDGHDSVLNGETSHHVIVANNVVYGADWCIYTRREDVAGDPPHNVIITGNNVSNCNVGINLIDGEDITVYGNHYENNVTDFLYDTDVIFSDTEIETGLDVFNEAVSGYAATFTNDGNDQNRYGLQVQAGADDASGTTYYLNALDGDGDQVGYIANSAGTFALIDPSDMRTKTNVTDTSHAGLGLVKDLRVVDFNRLQDPEGPRITGFIAQEVQDVYPEAILENPEGILGLNKSAFIPVLVKAVQDLDEKINLVAGFDDTVDAISDLVNDFLLSTKDKVINGIVTVGEFIAEAITTQKITTQEFCVGETCISETEFKALLDGQSVDPIVSTNNNDSNLEDEDTDEEISIDDESENNDVDSSESSANEENLDEDVVSEGIGEEVEDKDIEPEETVVEDDSNSEEGTDIIVDPEPEPEESDGAVEQETS